MLFLLELTTNFYLLSVSESIILLKIQSKVFESYSKLLHYYIFGGSLKYSLIIHVY